MAELYAGFGRSDITPRLGCKLVGYSNRKGGATGVHDPLTARALVLKSGAQSWALMSTDLCFVSALTVSQARTAIEKRTGIPASHILIATTHNHSGPDDGEAGNWDRPLTDLLADAVAQAQAALQPASLGSAFGFLYGHSINRRWLDRPVDPALGVIRVDAADGRPLGMVANFACHGVVLGPDNLLISADWPGQACRHLEKALGEGSTCLYFQGGCANVNPLVAGVRQRLEAGHTVVSIGGISHYYGPADDPQAWNIGDRSGGTFAEVDELAEAFAKEALHVWRSIHPNDNPQLWSQQLTVDAKRSPDEPISAAVPPMPVAEERLEAISDEQGRIPAEIMLVKIGDALLLSEPGEVFSETAVTFRTRLRLLGYPAPMLVGYANGVLAYLPEPEAFDEGGYEPTWPSALGISRYFQRRVWEAVEKALKPG